MSTLDTSYAPSPRPVAADYTGAPNTPAFTGNELVAVGDESAAIAGRIVWWRLQGDVSRAELLDIMATIGADLSLAPPPPSPAAALANTLQTVGREVSALPRPCGNDLWALVHERVEKRRRRVRWNSTGPGATMPPPAETVEGLRVEGLDEEGADVRADGEEAPPVLPPTVIDDPGAPIAHDTLATVRLVAEPTGLRLHVKTLDEALAAKLHDAFAYFRDALSTREVSAWLTRCVATSLDGVSLRYRGGIYYLPPTSESRWSELIQALRASSGHRVSSVPAMTAADTASAVLDALQSQAEDFVNDTFARVADLKRNAANTRIATARDLRAKVLRYETLFGEGRLEALRLRLAGLEATLSTLAVTTSGPA